MPGGPTTAAVVLPWYWDARPVPVAAMAPPAMLAELRAQRGCNPAIAEQGGERGTRVGPSAGQRRLKRSRAECMQKWGLSDVKKALYGMGKLRASYMTTSDATLTMRQDAADRPKNTRKKYRYNLHSPGGATATGAEKMQT